jgi:hypothetical protein
MFRVEGVAKRVLGEENRTSNIQHPTSNLEPLNDIQRHPKATCLRPESHLNATYKRPQSQPKARDRRSAIDNSQSSEPSRGLWKVPAKCGVKGTGTRRARAETEDDKWQMADGRSQAASGKWQVASGRSICLEILRKLQAFLMHSSSDQAPHSGTSWHLLPWFELTQQTAALSPPFASVCCPARRRI